MGIDKASIVIDNYFDSECDVNTTIRQAYERGFRRCASKYNLSNMRTSKLLEDENAKLRKLMQVVGEFLGDINCDGCPCKRDCDGNNRMFCGYDLRYHAFQTIRELMDEVTK